MRDWAAAFFKIRSSTSGGYTIPCSFTLPPTRFTISAPSAFNRSCSRYRGFFDPPRLSASPEKIISMICSLAVLEFRVMFETKFYTYWADADPAGIVFFPHFFKYVEQAEEELFRASGTNRQTLLEEHRVWMPRVEAFSKFLRPIRVSEAIRVRLNPQFKGEKTIRYEFEIVEDATSETIAEGYVTVVCVDAAGFKATAIPEAIRAVLRN